MRRAARLDSSAAAVPGTIGTLRVTGNATTDSARILRTFEVQPGSRFSEDQVRRGLRKLYALQLFDDIDIEQTPHDGVVDLVIHVRERPRIAKITFTGNRAKATSDLEHKLFLHPGEVYSPTAVRTQIDSLILFYRDQGYARAAIESSIDTSGAGGRVALLFTVTEGEKVKITRIRFEGATAFKEKKLRKQMKTKAKGLFGGGDLKEENFTTDREKLESWYHDHGYRDMRVVDHRLDPGDNPRHLTLVVTIDEGRPYWIGNVTWTGNRAVDDATLRKIWMPKPGEKYDASRIDKAQAAAYAEYAEKGYLYLGIEPRETVRDSLVDGAFVISEGQPSNVRLVNILGNRSTREKVIRREISIHEGDRFRRSSLVRTQGDIFRLGLFEDVQVDFTPAESTDVDVNLKVKEKQVGTASAGAGYTSESGLTGFLELGHNNVLGNGQSVSLHLERGGKRSDYYLSFTEPWFRDTPTLLGFSLFNTALERDVYNEKRAGGSVRVGRPLPWPDYSRGSATYQLENVKIEKLGTFTVVDSVALLSLGDLVGRNTLTSSVELQYLRNSTNNPFYPTRGSKISTDDNFAGGAFGGAVNFHKHRIEGKFYLPSLLKSVTTMVRARVGLIGTYTGQYSDVPAYERFRLGGGTTPDPLRGYDDYQVVPEKFIRYTATAFRTDTTVVSPGDTMFTKVATDSTKLRYPGGRYLILYSIEQQFPIVQSLHGVLFFDAGNTWDLWHEIKPWDLKMSAGLGLRIEIPLLGNVGFDYGYGFNRDDGPKARGHFLFGNVNF